VGPIAVRKAVVYAYWVLVLVAAGVALVAVAVTGASLAWNWLVLFAMTALLILGAVLADALKVEWPKAKGEPKQRWPWSGWP
jgi:hypothetical protein